MTDRIVELPALFPPPSDSTMRQFKHIQATAKAVDAQTPDVSLNAINAAVAPQVRAMVSSIANRMMKGRESEFFEENLKTWGLPPCAEIAYGGAFGMQSLTHHAIYIGDGMVIEVGGWSCPIRVLKKVSLSTFTNQCFGPSTLQQFEGVAHKNTAPIERVLYEGFDDQPAGDAQWLVTYDRYFRLLELLEKHEQGWDYNPLTNNCQHATSFISTGLCFSRQFQVGEGISRLVKLKREAFQGVTGCTDNTCEVRYRTKRGSYCEEAPTKSMLYGTTCPVVTPGGTRTWDYVDPGSDINTADIFKTCARSKMSYNRRPNDQSRFLPCDQGEMPEQLE